MPSLKFFSPEQLVEFGLPHPHADEDPAERATWAELQSISDQQVVTRFPQLANPPPHHQRPITQAPYRLYNLIAPLSDIDSDRSIAFIGHILVGNYFRGVEAQAMWATAYFDGKLVLPDAQQRKKDVALLTAWCRRRYLTNGEKGIWIVFELVGYADRLLEQLGLKSHKKRGFIKTWFEPCKQSDFKGLKDEYIAKYEKPSVAAVTNGTKKAEIESSSEEAVEA